MESTVSSNDGKRVEFTVRVITEADMEAVIKVLGSSFMTEAMISCGDLRLEEVEKFVRLHTHEILADDLTLIAETADGRVCGVAMSLDFATPLPDALVTYVTNHRHLDKIVTTLDQLEEHYVTLQGCEQGGLPRGHTVHIYMTGVDAEFRKMGVAQAMRRAALDHYRAKKFRFAMTETTSRFARKINSDLGFETKWRLPFDKIFPNEKMKEQIARGNDAAYLMVLQL